MANYFLKVDKDLFKMGLSPLEILLVAQITEFNTNTGDCFISDKTLAANFGVSEKTISRSLKALEDRGIITRETRNVKGGKERHIKVNEYTTTDKMTVNSSIQPTICPLSTDKLSFDNGQNDLIKDNLIDKEKDNICFLLPNGNKKGEALAKAKAANSQKEEAVEIDGQQAQVMTSQEALNKYGLSACANRIKAGITNCYWINGELVKLV